MIEYTNRYGDKFTFTRQEDDSVLWEGSFEYHRTGRSNDYTLAYQNYCQDALNIGTSPMCIEDFKKEFHESFYDENGCYVEPSLIGKLYADFVKLNPWINMVDPTGGPYIRQDFILEKFGKELKGLRVQRFEPIETGYKIVTTKS